MCIRLRNGFITFDNLKNKSTTYSWNSFRKLYLSVRYKISVYSLSRKRKVTNMKMYYFSLPYFLGFTLFFFFFFVVVFAVDDSLYYSTTERTYQHRNCEKFALIFH